MARHGRKVLKNWEKKDSSVLAKTRIFTLLKKRVTNPRTNAEFDVFVLDCPDWVNVIALTPDDEVVLVRQYRHGVEKVTLEIPGGMVDEGETPEEAGIRELLEETGFKPKEVVNLGFVEAQPAFQGNRCHTFLLKDCERAADPDPDGGEDLEVVLAPLPEMEAMMADGRIAHGLVVAAFMRLKLHLGKNP